MAGLCLILLECCLLAYWSSPYSSESSGSGVYLARWPSRAPPEHRTGARLEAVARPWPQVPDDPALFSRNRSFNRLEASRPIGAIEKRPFLLTRAHPRRPAAPVYVGRECSDSAVRWPPFGTFLAWSAALFCILSTALTLCAEPNHLPALCERCSAYGGGSS